MPSATTPPRAWTPSTSTTKAFGLVNRFIDMQDSVPAMGDTDTNAAFKNRVPAGRADGMVIVAHEAVESSTNSRTRKKYKGVTYDTDENVQVQQGGDGGFIKIPETSVTDVVWDDSYSDQWAASNPVLDRAERERSYDGIYQPAFENGLPGRTVALTQWHYVTHDLWKSFALRHAHLVYNLLTKEDLEKLGIDKMDPIEAMKTIDKSTDATLELAWQLLYEPAPSRARRAMCARLAATRVPWLLGAHPRLWRRCHLEEQRHRRESRLGARGHLQSD